MSSDEARPNPPTPPPTQPTQPAKGKPVEIPVPTRDAVLRDLEKAAAPKPGQDDRFEARN